jgi:hypothetical protein
LAVAYFFSAAAGLPLTAAYIVAHLYYIIQFYRSYARYAPTRESFLKGKDLYN